MCRTPHFKTARWRSWPLPRSRHQQEVPALLPRGRLREAALPVHCAEEILGSLRPNQNPATPNKFRPKDAPAYSILPGGELRKYKVIPEGSIPDDLARQLKHGYYAAISYMDAPVGKVLDELDRLDLRKNTIVILWGDHGWKLGEHDAWCKHSTVENDTNVALLPSVPGMKNAGAKTNSIIEFVDIYPTLAELAGVPLPKHLEGFSFKPLLENPRQPWKQAAGVSPVTLGTSRGDRHIAAPISGVRRPISGCRQRGPGTPPG